MKRVLFLLISLSFLTSCTQVQEDTTASSVTPREDTITGSLITPMVSEVKPKIEESVNYENADTLVRNIWSGTIWKSNTEISKTPYEGTRRFQGKNDEYPRDIANIGYFNIKTNLEECKSSISYTGEKSPYDCYDESNLEHKIQFYKKLNDGTIQEGEDFDIVGPVIAFKRYKSGYLILRHAPDNEEVMDLLLEYITLDTGGDNYIDYFSYLGSTTGYDDTESIFGDYIKKYTKEVQESYNQEPIIKDLGFDSEKYRKDNATEFMRGQFEHKAIQSWYTEALSDIDKIPEIIKSLGLTPKQ